MRVMQSSIAPVHVKVAVAALKPANQPVVSNGSTAFSGPYSAPAELDALTVPSAVIFTTVEPLHVTPVASGVPIASGAPASVIVPESADASGAPESVPVAPPEPEKPESSTPESLPPAPPDWAPSLFPPPSVPPVLAASASPSAA